MGQNMQELTKQILWRTAFKKFAESTLECFVSYKSSSTQSFHSKIYPPSKHSSSKRNVIMNEVFDCFFPRFHQFCLPIGPLQEYIQNPVKHPRWTFIIFKMQLCLRFLIFITPLSIKEYTVSPSVSSWYLVLIKNLLNIFAINLIIILIRGKKQSIPGAATKSSQRRCFVRKSVLRNLVKFTRKHLCQSLFFNKDSGKSKHYENMSNNYARKP